MVEMGRERGAPMQPLRGWYFKPRFFPQGGASLTLGFVMEPLRGSCTDWTIASREQEL